jgi:phosphate transport system protein
MPARTRYIHELAEIQRAFLQLSEAIARAIRQAMWVLQQNDVRAARRIQRADDEIDERRADIEERVLHLLAAQQPIATDLRFLLAAMRIADELERMGDYTEGIAGLVIQDAAEPAVDLPPELHPLAAQAQTMLQTSISAFVARDASAVASLERADESVNNLNHCVQAAMLHQMQTAPQTAKRALHILFVAHNLERIADRAVNIAERTVFMVTGRGPADHC